MDLQFAPLLRQMGLEAMTQMFDPHFDFLGHFCLRLAWTTLLIFYSASLLALIVSHDSGNLFKAFSYILTAEESSRAFPVRLLVMSFMCVCLYNRTKKFHREVSASVYNLSDSVCITVIVY